MPGQMKRKLRQYLDNGAAAAPAATAPAAAPAAEESPEKAPFQMYAVQSSDGYESEYSPLKDDEKDDTSPMAFSKAKIARIATQDQMTVHTAKAMVLSCMDFRLLDDIVHFMDTKGYNVNYDQFILAGASMCYRHPKKYKHWVRLFETHLDLAMKLHHITEIFCIDHDKCGAYKLQYPEMKPEEEHARHERNMRFFRGIMNLKFPDIKVHLYLMSLDGSCQHII